MAKKPVKLPGFLGKIEEVYPNCAILKSEHQGSIYMPMSSFRSPTVTTAMLTDVRKFLSQDEWVFYEAVPLFQPVSGCFFQAVQAFKTVRGVGKICRLKRGHGFVKSDEYGELFFPGAAVPEDFLGLHDLEKCFKIGDEVSFIAWNQVNIQATGCLNAPGTRNYKAEKIIIPPFLSSDPQRKYWGFVVRVFSNGSGMLFCKSLGSVSLCTKDIQNFNSGPLKVGQRFLFALGESPQTNGFKGAKLAQFVNKEENCLMKVQITNRGGFDPRPPPPTSVVAPMQRKHKAEALQRTPVSSEYSERKIDIDEEEDDDEWNLDDDWLEEVEKELNSVVDKENIEEQKPLVSEATVNVVDKPNPYANGIPEMSTLPVSNAGTSTDNAFAGPILALSPGLEQSRIPAVSYSRPPGLPERRIRKLATPQPENSEKAELPKKEINRVSWLLLRNRSGKREDKETQTDGGMEERNIVETLMNDNEIFPMIVDKFPGFLQALMTVRR